MMAATVTLGFQRCCMGPMLASAMTGNHGRRWSTVCKPAMGYPRALVFV
jgi:hypothetical protein